MKKFQKKLTLIIIIWVFLLVTPSSSYPKTPQDGSGEATHPLGKPAHSLLIWENDEEFLKICAEYKTNIRMAAFQTTLPDPLPGEEYNVGLAAQMIAGTVVPSGKVFSMNMTLGPRTMEKGFRQGPAYSGSKIIRVIGGGICKVSTTLYNTAVLADMEIVERWSHGMLVPYVPPGQDATISYGTRDFKFRNTTSQPLLIWAEKVENTLFIAFYGGIIPPKVIWHHQTLRRQNTYQIQKYSHHLPPGAEKIIQFGSEGIMVKNWVTMHYRDGREKIKNLGIDYYSPMPEIVELGKNR